MPKQSTKTIVATTDSRIQDVTLFIALRVLLPNVEAHWPGAAASDDATETSPNRLLPVQCSEKLDE
jgi:hypothetical protein